jgi:hypothetical protein
MTPPASRPPHRDQHSFLMPHRGSGQTPDDVFERRAAGVTEQLAAGHDQAGRARIAANRKLTCAASPAEVSRSGVGDDDPNPPVISEMRQLRTADPKMS